ESYGQPNGAIACGVNNTHVRSANSSQVNVIDGRDALPGEVPEYAAVTMEACLFGKFHCLNVFCGGSIWNNRTIITAAHCVDIGSMDDLFVKTFTVCIGVREKEGSEDRKICSKTTNYVKHRFYNRLTNVNDIAIIIFNYELRVPYFTKDGDGSTNKFCPPNENFFIPTKNSCFVVGFGIYDRSTKKMAQKLQIAPMKCVSNEECKKTYSGVTNSQICAKGPSGQTACNGDSGGPLLCLDADGRAHLVGIVSYGTRNCPENRLSVFTRISSYIDFINKNCN
ncbi:hypothetical protein B4U79_07101, partial [Dinothrombium tinctorium]